MSRKRPHATAPDEVPCDVLPLIGPRRPTALFAFGVTSQFKNQNVYTDVIANEKFVVDNPHKISFFQISRWRNLLTYAKTSEIYINRSFNGGKPSTIVSFSYVSAECLVILDLITCYCLLLQLSNIPHGTLSHYIQRSGVIIRPSRPHVRLRSCCPMTELR